MVWEGTSFTVGNQCRKPSEPPQKTCQPYNPAISLFSICPKEQTSCFTDTSSAMFIVALFKVSRKQIPPKCSSTDECIMKMWFVCFSTVKKKIFTEKKEKIKFESECVELENIILSKVTQTQKELNVHSHLRFLALNLKVWIYSLRSQKSKGEPHWGRNNGEGTAGYTLSEGVNGNIRWWF